MSEHEEHANDDRWMSPQDARRYLGLPSLSALYSMKARGELPYYQLGRRLRFRRSEMDALLEAGRCRATTPAFETHANAV